MNHESCRLPLISINIDSVMGPYDFDNPINHADKDGEEDCELPGELAELLKQESKVIKSHESQ